MYICDKFYSSFPDFVKYVISNTLLDPRIIAGDAEWCPLPSFASIEMPEEKERKRKREERVEGRK